VNDHVRYTYREFLRHNRHIICTRLLNLNEFVMDIEDGCYSYILRPKDES